MASKRRSRGPSLSKEDQVKQALLNLPIPFLDLRFLKKELIYQGKTREVHKVTEASGKILALKHFDNPLIWRTELENHLLFRGCDYFPSFIGITPSFDIMMEFIDGTDLPSLKDPSLSYLLYLFYELAKALQVINKKGCSYVDLKPANIRICGRKIFLLDLGSIMPFGSDSLIMTTRAYNDPQMLSGGKPSEKLDVWALGALILEMRGSSYVRVAKFWRQPFEGAEDAIIHLLEEVKKEACLQDPLGQFVLTRMMVVDMEKRATIDEVVEFFN